MKRGRAFGAVHSQQSQGTRTKYDGDERDVSEMHFESSLNCVAQRLQTQYPGHNMNPAKVSRDRLDKLTDLPNVGPSIAGDLERLGIKSPKALIGRDPLTMYNTLCTKTGVRHDPCVLDVFISITRFMDGEDAKPWWDYTEERKAILCSSRP